MSLTLQASTFLNRRFWYRWERLTQNPWQSQQNLLSQLVRRNQSTEFGKDHRFDTIHSLEDYRDQVPISDYECFRPYIERAKEGEARTLTHERILMFTITSGNQGEPKFFPVTPTVQANRRHLTRLWYHRVFVDHPQAFSSKLLGMISPAVEGRTPRGIPFGAASGLIYQSSPRWIRNAYVIPFEVLEIKEFETKCYLIMRLGLEHNISFFITPNPSTILKLLENADLFKEEMIKDIRDGTLSSRIIVPAELRKRLSATLSHNAPRAKELEGFATLRGRLRPREYWPGLQLIGCWKGGALGAILEEFNRWFVEGTPIRDLGYVTSEAQVTLPLSDVGSAGILAIDKNFYEFIPETEIGNSRATVLTLDELDEGKHYSMVLTTPGGLYRYDTNDVVRVAGFYNKTPLLEFARKGGEIPEPKPH